VVKKSLRKRKEKFKKRWKNIYIYEKMSIYMRCVRSTRKCIICESDCNMVTFEKEEEDSYDNRKG